MPMAIAKKYEGISSPHPFGPVGPRRVRVVKPAHLHPVIRIAPGATSPAGPLGGGFLILRPWGAWSFILRDVQPAPVLWCVPEVQPTYDGPCLLELERFVERSFGSLEEGVGDIWTDYPLPRRVNHRHDARLDSRRKPIPNVNNGAQISVRLDKV